MFHKHILTLSALAFAGCGASDSIGQLPDAGGRDAGVGLNDGSLRDAGASGDASPIPGIRIADLPADIVAIPEGAEEIVFLKAGALTRIAPDGTGERSLELRPTRGYGPTPNLWFWSEVDASGAIGALSSYVPGAAAAQAIERRCATDAFTASPEGDAALAVTRVVDSGGTTSSTRTAALEWLPIAGERRVLVPAINLGPYDMRARAHRCSPQLEVMSDTRALAIVCLTPGSAARTLLAIDVQTSSVTVVAEDVQPFLRASEDRSFALYLDADVRFRGVSADGSTVRELIEPRGVVSMGLLDGAKIAYTTTAKDLLVAEWPALRPRVVVRIGAESIQAISPDGRFVMFRQVRAPTGLSDLFVVDARTASATPTVLEQEPSAYPGDEAFSEDSRWAQWFARADANFVGAITIRPSEGGESRVIAERGWIVLNHAEPDRLVILGNARFEGTKMRVDLSTPRRDGAEDRTLVVGIDPAAFELFPDRRRAVFRISEGAHSGLWVREL